MTKESESAHQLREALTALSNVKSAYHFVNLEVVKERAESVLAELAACQAACAEMRRVLVGFVAWVDQPDGTQPDRLIPLRESAYKALSTDFGRGHVSAAELEKSKVAWEKIRGFGRGDMGAQQLADYVTETADEELARLEALKGGAR